MAVELTVNGQRVAVEATASTLLVQALRDHLKLTGTHVGCDTAQCGACTVIVNGNAVKSCNLLLQQAAGAEVTTIEGLASADGTLHPMQAAFQDCHGLQCGFCTSGMVMSAVDLIQKNPRPPQRRFAKAWRVTCAGAQATKTSSKPSNKRPQHSKGAYDARIRRHQTQLVG